MTVAVWCSGNALVLNNAVALDRARLVLGWVTAFGQVNYLLAIPPWVDAMSSGDGYGHR